MTEVTRIVDKIREKPYILSMGAGKVADWLDVSPESVREAKRVIYGERVVCTKAGPRILFLDIETAPLLVGIFQKQVWKARIRHDHVFSDWFILTFSCKFLGDDNMISGRLTSEEAENQDDSRLVGKLWSLLCDADIVICHGGDYFDIPNINTRFVALGLGPTTYYKQIDTLKVAQRQFGFTHNTLGALADFFGLPAKIETTFELWKRCYKAEESALFEMEVYNRRDVEVLEQVYLRLRPWIKSHPNLGVYSDTDEVVCSHCKGHNLEPDGGYYVTHTGRYPTYRCLDCGAVTRNRKSDLPRGKIKLVSIPGR